MSLIKSYLFVCLVSISQPSNLELSNVREPTKPPGQIDCLFLN